MIKQKGYLLAGGRASFGKYKFRSFFQNLLLNHQSQTNQKKTDGRAIFNAPNVPNAKSEKLLKLHNIIEELEIPSDNINP